MNNNPDCYSAQQQYTLFFLFQTSIHFASFKIIIIITLSKQSLNICTWRNILNPTKAFTKFASPINLDRLYPHPSLRTHSLSTVLFMFNVLYFCVIYMPSGSWGLCQFWGIFQCQTADYYVHIYLEYIYWLHDLFMFIYTYKQTKHIVFYAINSFLLFMSSHYDSHHFHPRREKEKLTHSFCRCIFLHRNIL